MAGVAAGLRAARTAQPPGRRDGARVDRPAAVADRPRRPAAHPAARDRPALRPLAGGDHPSPSAGSARARHGLGALPAGDDADAQRPRARRGPALPGVPRCRRRGPRPRRRRAARGAGPRARPPRRRSRPAAAAQHRRRRPAVVAGAAARAVPRRRRVPGARPAQRAGRGLPGGRRLLRAEAAHGARQPLVALPPGRDAPGPQARTCTTPRRSGCRPPGGRGAGARRPARAQAPRRRERWTPATGA